MREALREDRDCQYVDFPFRGLILVDQQGPRQQQNAYRRTYARGQPFAHLAAHLCGNGTRVNPQHYSIKRLRTVINENEITFYTKCRVFGV